MLEEYKQKHRVKIGLAPTRRILTRKNFFNKADAIKEKDIIEDTLDQNGIEYVNLDFLNEEGLLYQGCDSDRAAKKFIEAGVDAIFAPHCNFGTEDAVAKLAKKVNKPLLLWGPRDGAPKQDGSRERDSQCGLFATSKVLQQFGVPFTYIPNTRVEDALFKKGLKNFISAAAVVKSMTNLRIGQIGTRPAGFWTVKCNEEELLERFGIEVVPVTIPEIKSSMDEILSVKPVILKETINDIKIKIDRIDINDEALQKTAALKIAIRQWADAEGLSAIAMLCNKPVREAFGITPCFTMSDLTDDGLPVICETDIHGAVTSIMTQAAVLGDSATFLADMTVRHPENDNAELLWHCGVFPQSLKSRNSKTVLNNHYGANFPGACEWEIEGGDITVSRFDGVSGEYKLLLAEGRGIQGPKNNGTYVWVEFRDWMKMENRLINGPYIHHCTGVHGKAAAALYEACKYIPGLTPDPVDPTREEIENFLIR